MVEGLGGQPDAGADLIIAADAMVYLSDLAPLLREVERVLVADGLLAFTVETHGSDGVILGEGLRYAHGAGYVRTSIREAGLTLSRLENSSTRNEDNVPVPSLVVVAGKT
jgi:predicted TPR repeat methyltransferase